MSRPPKLTEFQKAEIGRRLALGESGRALAREFGIGEATLRRNFSTQTAKIKNVATRLVSVEGELLEMPVSAQMAVRSLADNMKAAAGNLAKLALIGSDTAVRLATRANLKAAKADEAGGEMDLATQATIAGLTLSANRAAAPAVSLLAADQRRPQEESEDEGVMLYDLSTLSPEEKQTLLPILARIIQPETEK